ncbi:MAG: C69 family dipeptidase, partial [Acidimicrobiales bacterium]|nr:C69 family dipeptidase [Acidimicrobiales bacterium]
MCDTLCVLGGHGTLFAKNSDRPVRELQVVEAHGRRPPGGRLRTQYLELPDDGAAATLLSRPSWLWGAEHGVNEHGVAIGNEMVNTVDDPRAAPPALLGMDLVRLGLERAASAEDALDVMTGLLERHGQGGVGDSENDVAYWSSFLLSDRASAWVLETSGRSWAARPIEGGGAISNRLTLRRDWTRASPGVAPGTDLDTWRDPGTPTGFADGRLAASRAFVARRVDSPVSDVPSGPARAAVAHLRDHGSGAWGAPGSDGPVVGAPTEVLSDGTGVTLCMHIRDFEATTASMVAELPVDARRDGPGRAWVAL